MRVVYNLITEEEMHFDEKVTPTQAVKMSYAMTSGLGTQAAIHGSEAIDVELLEGKHFITCGNWTTRK
jgi:hypothetical protein